MNCDKTKHKQIVHQHSRSIVVKIYLTSSLITMKNLVVISHTVHVHVGGPKHSGNAGLLPPWDGVLLTPRNTPLPTC